jgi:hypothetical protein
VIKYKIILLKIGFSFVFSDVAIFGLWRPENEPRVNLLVGLESSKFTAGNISAGTLNLRGLDLTQMVMDIWRPGSTVILRSC